MSDVDIIFNIFNFNGVLSSIFENKSFPFGFRN